MAVHLPALGGRSQNTRSTTSGRSIAPRTLAALVVGTLALGSVALGRIPRDPAAPFDEGASAARAGVLSLAWPARTARVSAVSAGSANPKSGPIALSPDDKFVWMVDPDADLVSVVRVEGDANQVVRQIPVGREPACVALSPANNAAFVTNSIQGTVTVITFPAGNPAQAGVAGTLNVGTEPFGVLVTPDGSTVYVANRNSGNVSVIAVTPQGARVVRTVANVGYLPTGLAYAEGRVYVTQLLAQLRSNGRPVERNEGEDDGKEGRITVINTTNNVVEGTIVLNPLTPFQVGFRSNGSTLDRIPPRNNAAGQPLFDFDTGAFPNLLWSLGIKNGRAYVPAVGASPNGPFRFNVNCQSVLSVVNLGTGVEEPGKTINMNKGIGAEKVGSKLFLSNPSAVAFKHNADEGYVVLSGIDQIVRVTLAADGRPSVGAPSPVRIFTTPSPNGDYLTRGKNPRDIVINSTDTRAYVACQLSKDVAVIDLRTNTRLANIPTGELPPLNSFSGQLLRGKQLFNSSIGPEGTQENSRAPAGRMSDFGWGNCASCHPDGRTDGVTWMFPDGPRQTISLDGTFDHRFQLGRISLDHIRILNWSAVRDEVQDFELNTRAVFGGQGLIRDGRAVINLINADGTGEANIGRDPDLEALAIYQAYGIRTPIAPPISEAEFLSGARLFDSMNCTSCHSGRQWTNSIRNFTPPPKQDRTGAQVLINSGQLVGFLRNVGTFDATKFNEVRANANVDGFVPPANGALGINPPSLLGLAATAPYFHSGEAQTLEQVIDHVPHRTAGNPAADLLVEPANRELMVKFLRSLDSIKRFFQGP